MKNLIQVRLDVEEIGLMITAYLPSEVALMLLKGLNRKGKPLRLPFDVLVGLDQFGKVCKEVPPKPKLEEASWLAESVQEAADFLREVARERGVSSLLVEEIEEEGHSDEGSRIRVSNYLGLLEIPPGTIRWPEASPSHLHAARS